METAKTRFDGDLWFFSEITDPKITEIKLNNRVNISYASIEHRRFVSVSGIAEIVRDAQKAELLWDESLERWFPDGRQPTDLVLIKVAVTDAEYWDSHRSATIPFASVMTGFGAGQRQERVEHEKIDWQQQQQS